jgi:hypothetical protein
MSVFDVDMVLPRGGTFRESVSRGLGRVEVSFDDPNLVANA